MIHTALKQARRSGPLLLALLLAMGALAACGDGDDVVIPTESSVDSLATEDAQRTAVALASLPPSDTPTATDLPSATPVPPSETPTASLTPTAPPPSATATQPPAPAVAALPASATSAPTDIPPADLTATAEAGLALTGTAEVAALEQTQAALAADQMTQIAQTANAVVIVTLTPTPEAPTFTPEITLTESPSLTPTITATTAPPPGATDAIIYYGDRFGSEDIFLRYPDGTTRALTSGLADEREPSCAPDGGAFVFASNAGGTYQIYRQDVASTEPQQLTTEGDNFAPVFSPDGTSIVFVSTRRDGVATIWLMDADGARQRQLTTELGRDTSPSWGPSGDQIIFASDQGGAWNVFVAPVVEGAEGEGEFPLPQLPAFTERNQLWPFFDTDEGTRIVYTAWDNPVDPQTADILLIDFEQPEPVTVRATVGADIAWSWYDDTRILASLGGEGNVQIALVDVLIGDAEVLTNSGTFNGGARRCYLRTEDLPPEPTPAPSPTPAPTSTPTLTPTPSPTPRPVTSYYSLVSAHLPAPLATVQGRPYTVQPGDTLNRISQRTGVPLTTIVQLNQVENPDRIAVGQTLVLPVMRFGHRQGGYQAPDSDETGVVPVRKKIVVRLNEQTVYAYEDGRVVRTVLASTGLPATPTVQGEFKIYTKLEAQTMSGPGYYLPGVPYVMYFYQGYGLHGTYWHENFGHPMSHGCVNLPTPDAKWFYEWAEVGTPVEVLS